MGFKATNNEEEYETLLAGLRVPIELGVESLDTFSNSQLVVSQVQGDYLTKDDQMVSHLEEMKALLGKIKDFKICQNSRKENRKADTLATRT